MMVTIRHHYHYHRHHHIGEKWKHDIYLLNTLIAIPVLSLVVVVAINPIYV